MDTMDKPSWHLSKKLTVGVLITIVTSIGGFAWAAAGMHNRMENVEVWKSETSENRFTAQDAKNFEYRLSLAEKQNEELLHKIGLLITDVAVIKSILWILFSFSKSGLAISDISILNSL